MAGIMRNITIEAPAAKVWARVGKFQDMSWHPDVRKTDGTGGEELQATRVLHLASGGTVAQTLVDREALSYLGASKRVDAKALPVDEFSLDVRVLEGSASKCQVNLSASIVHMVADGGKDDAASEAIDQTVRDFLDAGLQSLKREMEARSE
jgi:hypothetical protein